jgi:histidinol phosphatase-like enzyme
MINKEWHLKNKMPKNPTKKQRIEWHIAHNKNCNCRKPTEKLVKEINEYLKENKLNEKSL